ncbi:hypothetical protein [Acidocella aromatica]|uniref:Uncharacterized protein n=1 Tax=Acidocella aromatica TaxID=1303579 RepID=A0A840V9W5_9PROT|nr:hypothetical protein [Acidocella aromatica]MBB5372738.1 hypothetical protein [Acidocella aromatica]
MEDELEETEVLYSLPLGETIGIYPHRASALFGLMGSASSTDSAMGAAGGCKSSLKIAPPAVWPLSPRLLKQGPARKEAQLAPMGTDIIIRFVEQVHSRSLPHQ